MQMHAQIAHQELHRRLEVCRAWPVGRVKQAPESTVHAKPVNRANSEQLRMQILQPVWLAQLASIKVKPVPSPAFRVFQASTKTIPAQLLVKTAIMVPTNRNPVKRSAFQCKQVSINPVQQPKLFVQRVNPVLVVTQRAKIA